MFIHLPSDIPGHGSISFILDVRPRRNPEALGTVTRDGYPVLLDRRGENHYILSWGADIPVLVVRRGFPLPDCVPDGAN